MTRNYIGFDVTQPPTLDSDGRAFAYVMLAHDTEGNEVSEQHCLSPEAAAVAALSWLESNPTHECSMMQWHEDGACWCKHGRSMRAWWHGIPTR